MSNRGLVHFITRCLEKALAIDSNRFWKPTGSRGGHFASHRIKRTFRFWFQTGLPICQEPESIEDDQQRRTFMEHDGCTQLQSEYGCGNEEADHAEAEPKILPNDAARLSAQADDEREVS